MRKILTPLFVFFILFKFQLHAQVQVSREFHHKNIFENEYVRVLDVRIQPGDTTLFHIHSTPSLFIYFTNTAICTQIKGKEWTKGKNAKGNASYRSFINDTLVHRVSNCDSLAFHVNDIELLKAFKPGDSIQPMPFNLLFNNEKAIAYRLNYSSLRKQVVHDRGPILALLVEGKELKYFDAKTNKSTSLTRENFMYIEPGSAFYFTTVSDEDIILVLFEIK